MTCDGTWAQRGFVSKYGVVLVIHLDTGFVIDYELLSKYCKFCEQHKDDRSNWYQGHEEQCNKNFEGSSPAMEMAGWKILWERYVDKCKFRYVTVISDGDSKAFNALKNEKVYGDDITITEEECLNHMEKKSG